MSLAACSTLPLLPPPFTSILSTPSTGAILQQDQSIGNHHRRLNPRHQQHHHSSFRSPKSLHALALDESAISSRKAAIATYGYNWLRPAGIAKTMLGRREEEAERDEMERQMREQEEMEEEMMRLDALRAQNDGDEANWTEGGREAEDDIGQQGDLDDEIPDADAGAETQDEHNFENGPGQEADLDDEIPDAGNTIDDDLGDGEEEEEEDDGDEAEDEDVNFEGESGITDTDRPVSEDHTSLRPVPPSVGGANFTAASSEATTAASSTTPHMPNARHIRLRAHAAAQQAYLSRRIHRVEQAQRQQHRLMQHQQQEEQEQLALANVMLDEDEQALAEQDLDADISIPGEEEEETAGDGGGMDRDLDDDIDEAEDEQGGEEDEGWQHTDTELELEDDWMIGPPTLQEGAQPMPAARSHETRRRTTTGNPNIDGNDVGDDSMEMSGLDEPTVGSRDRRVSGVNPLPIAGNVNPFPPTPDTETPSSLLSSSILHSPTRTVEAANSTSPGLRWLHRRSLFRTGNRLGGRTGSLFSGITAGGSNNLADSEDRRSQGIPNSGGGANDAASDDHGDAAGHGDEQTRPNTNTVTTNTNSSSRNTVRETRSRTRSGSRTETRTETRTGTGTGTGMGMGTRRLQSGSTGG